jgi:hypothetical protein
MHAELLTDPCPAEDWLDAEIATANSLFAPVGIQFRSSEQLGLTPEHAHIGDVVEIQQLVSQVRLADRAPRRFALDVFLVEDMFSSADAGGTGFAQARDPRPGLVVIAVTSANPALLAHELGHYIGLGHSSDPENPMFETAPGDAAFDPVQVSQLRARVFPFRREFDDMTPRSTL